MTATKKRVYPKKTDRVVWPEERVETLAMLWKQGVSASNIATAMSLAKSQVVGMAKRRRDADDVRFNDRRLEEPDDKEAVRETLARKIREMVGPARQGEAAAETARFGIHPSELSVVRTGWGLHKMSPAKLLQILKRIGARVQVDATITANGRSDVVVLPLHERSPI